MKPAPDLLDRLLAPTLEAYAEAVGDISSHALMQGLSPSEPLGDKHLSALLRPFRFTVKEHELPDLRVACEEGRRTIEGYEPFAEDPNAGALLPLLQGYLDDGSLDASGWFVTGRNVPFTAWATTQGLAHTVPEETHGKERQALQRLADRFHQLEEARESALALFEKWAPHVLPAPDAVALLHPQDQEDLVEKLLDHEGKAARPAILENLRELHKVTVWYEVKEKIHDALHEHD